MPITGPNSKKIEHSQTDFERSVKSNPMAMSMMIDSVVNMMQNTRPSLQQDQTNTFANNNGY
ncbi:MAG: hypothetical protein CMK50_05040 [Propionibacteriaceae bacterium]|jgi:hypothetical protein|nr:hypothetical protein [Propionibacteriaceae bacterium]MBT67204.1 hypothetical protein [Synechococcus sp. NP17]